MQEISRALSWAEGPIDALLASSARTMSCLSSLATIIIMMRAESPDCRGAGGGGGQERRVKCSSTGAGPIELPGESNRGPLDYDHVL